MFCFCYTQYNECALKKNVASHLSRKEIEQSIDYRRIRKSICFLDWADYSSHTTFPFDSWNPVARASCRLRSVTWHFADLGGKNGICQKYPQTCAALLEDLRRHLDTSLPAASSNFGHSRGSRRSPSTGNAPRSHKFKIID